MKSVHAVVWVVAMLAVNCAGQNKPDSVALKNGKDSLSYVLGRDVGGQLKGFGETLEMGAFTRGVREALSGKPSSIDSVAADSLRRTFGQRVQERLQEQAQQMAAENTTKSRDFLDKNKKSPGVKTTKSGLQYQVLEKGKGPKITTGDTAEVEYRGMLIDSTVFDSTETGKTAKFDLERIIPGLREGIQLMQEGARYRFYVPPELGYGVQGAPPVIPPNSVLIFDMRLVKVGKAGKQK